ncbi:hypothetical protein BC826DRAFT_738396 [Russula brevipes]|nr:hypothetical protein BC826DRAFT_738396 [Russula brevipes]
MAPPVRAVLDPNRISDGRAQPRASPSPNPRAVPSPVTTFSQRPQQAESISRFYSPPPQETRYTPPLDPSLTGSTESGNPYRPSSRHSQFDKSGSQLNLTGVALPASQPSILLPMRQNAVGAPKSQAWPMLPRRGTPHLNTLRTTPPLSPPMTRTLIQLQTNAMTHLVSPVTLR